MWGKLVIAAQSNDLVAGHYPFIQFDPDSGKFVVYGDASVFDESIVTAIQGIHVVQHTALRALLRLPSIQRRPRWRPELPDPLHQHLRHERPTDQVHDAPVVTTTYNAIQAFQEVSTIAIWNPIASIVFSSSMLPVLSTHISPPQVYNDPSNSLSSTGNNAGLFSVLTDFEVPYSANNQYRPTIDYNPGAEYRLLDMNSDHEPQPRRHHRSTGRRTTASTSPSRSNPGARRT